MKRKFIKAFTLTELMAVVIIIALLSGVAAGTYRKAVERTRVSDGLTAASSVLGALERYYVEHPDIRSTVVTTHAQIADSQLPLPNRLDISFPNQKTCTETGQAANRPYCFKTKYFETFYHTDGYADAVRAPSQQYQIRVYSNIFGSNLRQNPACITWSDQGKDLCVSAGYSNCTGSSAQYTCRRP